MTGGAFGAIAHNPEHHGQIVFETDPKLQGSIPSDQQALYAGIVKVETLLNTLLGDRPMMRDDYIDRLVGMAQIGLMGEKPQTAMAETALAGLKYDLLQRFGRELKRRLVATLGLYASIGVGFGTAVYVVLFLLDPALKEASNFALLWAAAMAGVWMSFAARRLDVDFDDLQDLHHQRGDAIVRLIFAGMLALFAGLAVKLGFLGFDFGGFKAATFTTSAGGALLLGGIFGLSEQALSLKVTQKASKAVSSAK